MIRAEAEITLVRVDDGEEGYSPTATVTKTGDTATITITDKSGTTQETISDGQDGAQGISVISVQTQYCLTDSSITPPTDGWADEQPGFVTGQYYWTRDKITYSNNTVGYSTPVYAQGLTLANEYALDAKDSALDAYNFASTAVSQLSVVEDIVGVLDLVAQNGDYQLTDDTVPMANKWYFKRSGSGTTADPYRYQVQQNVTFEYVLTSDTAIIAGKTYYTRSGSGTDQDPYVYVAVENPVVADIGTYYEYTNWDIYELRGIDSAIQNYVSSHLALVGDSLFLQTSSGNSTTRLELNTQKGVVLYGQNGSQVAQYGTDAIIGSETGFHITITPNYNNTGKPRLSFYRDATNEVAYISDDKLYITQSVVLQQMDVGDKVRGQWSWKVHVLNNNKNNLYLKWLG